MKTVEKFGKYFGAIVQGTNFTQSGFKKSWSAICNGYQKTTVTETTVCNMIKVSDPAHAGDLVWCNLSTFSGSVTRYENADFIRETYCEGKLLESLRMSAPKPERTTKQVIEQYRTKKYGKVTMTPEQITATKNIELQELIPMLYA